MPLSSEQVAKRVFKGAVLAAGWVSSPVKQTVQAGIRRVGFRPLDRMEANLSFRLISARYAKGSIVLTSNKHVRGWPEIFARDEILTTAILDRLLHPGAAGRVTPGQVDAIACARRGKGHKRPCCIVAPHADILHQPCIATRCDGARASPRRPP